MSKITPVTSNYLESYTHPNLNILRLRYLMRMNWLTTSLPRIGDLRDKR